jgi:hypothetical protein
VSCEHFEELLSRYVEGDLPEEDIRTVEAHLSRCERCSESLVFYYALEESLKGRKERIPSPGKTSEAVCARLGLPLVRTRRRAVWSIPIAACMVLSACVIIYLMQGDHLKDLLPKLEGVLVKSYDLFSSDLPGWIVRASGGESWILLVVYAMITAALITSGSVMLRRLGHR